MRSSQRVLLPLSALLLSILAAPTALSQNLLVNPGFDRDLAGWTVATKITPDPSPSPGYVEASATWVTTDHGGSSALGGLAAHALAYWTSDSTAFVTQCVAMPEGRIVSFGASFLTARQRLYAGGEARVTFYASADCTGASSGSWAASSLPSVIDGKDHSSNGAWLQASGVAVAPTGARSMLFGVGARATGYMSYAPAWVDAIADDAFLIVNSGALTTTLLPSAGWVRGAGGANWRTTFALVNPGSAGAAVTLKWLGHDGDGRSGYSFTYSVPAGKIVDAGDFEANYYGDYGAILMTSSSPSVFLQSETSTFVPGGGTVGQALPALGAADFAGATPKALAPIRENASFRTNLVLANATEIPITVHVALFGADGATLGSRDVDLPPLGMTQISRVAAALGAATLDLGRISVSTSTPGGLVAAYASVIDNITNDPRTLLPR
jgi:hypothetical protein